MITNTHCCVKTILRKHYSKKENKMKKLLIAVSLVATVFGITAQAQNLNEITPNVHEYDLRGSTRNVQEYNLQDQVALKGYDPVSYFPEGGGIAQMGKAEYHLDYMGAIYYFASEKHLQMFMKDANKYEPTYGGYCAWAMASGRKVDIDPSLFVIHGRRLHLFISEGTKAKFLADIKGTEDKADAFWKQISGEEPRK